MAVIALLPTLVTSEPLPPAFPKDRSTSELLKHCISVDYADTLASVFGGQLANNTRTDGFRLAASTNIALPSSWVLTEIGGIQAMSDAQKVGLSWEENWKSLGRTYWSATHSQESSPYTVAEGRLLLDHSLACLDFKVEMTRLNGPVVNRKKSQRVSLPNEVQN